MSVRLYHGDCLDILPTLDENSIDAIVTDPPYGLSDHSPVDVVACLTAWMSGQVFSNTKKGFMNADWDGWVPGPEVWRNCLKVLKPGGNMIVFSGTRSYDLMVMAIRLAGFEIRDQLCWLTSQGMPHGLDISKGIDKAAGAERKIIGKKKIVNYDGANRDVSRHKTATHKGSLGKYGYTSTAHGVPLTEASTDAAKQWQGFNTQLKPAVEPILLCRKPLDGSVVENVMKHGVGGLNIDACRIPVDLSIDDARLGGQGSWRTEKMAKNTYGNFEGERVASSPLGRFPTNVLWDGSEEMQAIFDSFGEKKSGVPGKRRKAHETYSMSGTLDMLDREEVGYADTGSVSRFFKSCEFSEEDRRIFYCPKVKPKERGASKHPTLKPLALMKYLCRLICPRGGIILDPFAGSGTTGAAAIAEGFAAILIEREAVYADEIRNRLMFFLDE